MTWLKAIEDILGMGEVGVNIKSQIRMARVIRELARALWKLQTDRDANVFDDLSEEADSIVQEIIK